MVTVPATELEHANVALHRVETVCGIDVSGSGALACLVPVTDPLAPSWLTWKARSTGAAACREIASQASEAFRAPAFAGCSAVWLEQPFGRPNAVAALSRTIGAVAGVCPFRIPVDMLSQTEWRALLGIRQGAGVKSRAQAWAETELGAMLSQSDDHDDPGATARWRKVSRDDNAADSYGIARAILAARTAYTNRR